MRRLVRAGALGFAATAALGIAQAQGRVGSSFGTPTTLQPPAAQPPATNSAPAKPANPNAATVNGEPIRLEEVDAFIKARLAVTPLTADQLRQLRTEVVNDLIDDLLLKQFLRQHGPKVEPAEIDAHFKALAAGLAKQGKTLADFYKETGQTEAQVRDTWTVLIQLSKYVRDRVKDDQLKAYFEANKDYFERVEVKVSHVLIRVAKSAPATEKAAAKEKLRALRAEIAAGRLDFADAARKHSQDPTALQGGDLGYILRRGMLTDEAFCKAAFALKVGEVSDVVETESGVHLIKVTDRKAGVPTTFERAAEDVRDAFTEDFRAELVAKLRKQAQVQITVP